MPVGIEVADLDAGRHPGRRKRLIGVLWEACMRTTLTVLIPLWNWWRKR